MRHFLAQIIPWDLIEGWQGPMDHLRKFYEDNPGRKEEDPRVIPEAANLLSQFLSSVLSPLTTYGWEGTDAAQLNLFLSDEKAVYQKLQKRMKVGWIGKEAKQPVELGSSEIRISIPEMFKMWPSNGSSPDGQAFTRGDYLRFVWNQLVTKCQTQQTIPKPE
jgi:hypothetical protein